MIFVTPEASNRLAGTRETLGGCELIRSLGYLIRQRLLGQKLFRPVFFDIST